MAPAPERPPRIKRGPAGGHVEQHNISKHSGAQFTALAADVNPAMSGERLPVLQAEIRAAHDAALRAAQTALERAREAGTDITEVETYVGDDPIGEVISLNLQRRQLTPSQLSLVGANIANLQWGGSRGNQYAKGSFDRLAITHKQAGQMLNIGEATVKRAATVKKKGTPNVVNAVRSGKVSVNAAYAAVQANPSQSTQESWTPDDIKKAAKASSPPRCRETIRNWYTPALWIERARRVLGSIDCDPASNGRSQ